MPAGLRPHCPARHYRSNSSSVSALLFGEFLASLELPHVCVLVFGVGVPQSCPWVSVMSRIFERVGPACLWSFRGFPFVLKPRPFWVPESGLLLFPSLARLSIEPSRSFFPRYDCQPISSFLESRRCLHFTFTEFYRVPFREIPFLSFFFSMVSNMHLLPQPLRFACWQALFLRCLYTPVRFRWS